MKRCSKCGFLKILSEFKPDTRYSLGLFCWCKTCEKLYSASPDVRKRAKLRWRRKMKSSKERAKERLRCRTKYAKNPRRSKENWFRLKYGIELSEFEKIRRCVLCDRKKPLVADHDHKTNKFRGAVCRRCNLALEVIDSCKEWLPRVSQHILGGI